jgi:hypothetical protein
MPAVSQVLVHYPGVASRRTLIPPAELEMMIGQHAVPEQFSGAPACPEPSSRHIVEQLADWPPLVRRHARVERRVLRSKSGLALHSLHAVSRATRARRRFSRMHRES